MKRKFFSTGQVAELLGVAPVTVGRWIDSGELQGPVTPGGHRKIPIDSLDDFMKKRGYLVKRHKRVLVVDDEKNVRAALALFISKFSSDYEVKTAADGFIGGELTVSFDPDLILLDIVLPGIDGVEVCRRIKNKYPHKIIIGMKGYSDDETEREFIDAGGKFLLKKPIDPDIIRSILKEI